MDRYTTISPDQFVAQLISDYEDRILQKKGMLRGAGRYCAILSVLEMYAYVHTQIDEKTEEQTVRQTDRQTDRQTNNQTDKRTPEINDQMLAQKLKHKKQEKTMNYFVLYCTVLERVIAILLTVSCYQKA